jgi:gas vesicle protein
MAQQSKFGIGLVVGTVLGGLAALLFTPTTGKETREMAAKKLKELQAMIEEGKIDDKVREIFGDVTSDSVKLYAQSREILLARLDEMKKKVEVIDKGKYMAIVDEIVSKSKSDMKVPGESISKLKDYLVADWGKFTKQQEEKKIEHKA